MTDMWQERHWLPEVRAQAVALHGAISDAVTTTERPTGDRVAHDARPTWRTGRAASLVACCRIHTGAHHPSDVVVGAPIGAVCGSRVRRPPERQVPSAQSAGAGHVTAD